MLTYTFTNLSKLKGIRHAVFTRMDGVSEKPFDTLNVSSAVGDVSAAVNTNFEKIQEYFDTTTLLNARQTHSDKVIKVDFENIEALANITSRVEGDALVTDMHDTAIMVKTADCQPVLLADPVGGVIAAVHSGWRGSVQNILGKTIAKMINEFDCQPENIVAGIGPSLGPCCAEFKNYKEELPPEFWQYETKPNYFNFWRISAMQLKEAGVPENNIEVCNLCTMCYPDLFFSYRLQKITGRFGSAIMLER